MSTAGKHPKHPNNIQRFLRGKSIVQAARELSIAERTFRSWVLGEVRVPQHCMSKLTEYFNCTSEQLLTKPIVPLGNIPYQRNPFFTGREALLRHIHSTLHKNTLVAAAPPLALCGLGGIGKTQTVIEYTYRYCNDYDIVLWVKADTRENVVSDILRIATLLHLPETQNPSGTLQAVKRWLQEHRDWLLIFDNADDLSLVIDVVPANYQGHILLTTRTQAMGRFAHRLDVEIMDERTGVFFVLRRSGCLSSDDTLGTTAEEERVAATELVRELGGLPLALDQAGAYMEECQCSFVEYLQLYRKQRIALLAKRGGIVDDHPAPVATTWSISFYEVEHLRPAAADLLRACAFLDPDVIPEELLVSGASELGPVLANDMSNALVFNQVVAALWKYSLVHRNSVMKFLSVHRLVQVVLKEEMEISERRTWAERTIRALYSIFPCEVTLDVWPKCQQLLPHVLLCTSYVEQYGIVFAEAATLFNQAGYYLRERALYKEAEAFFQCALSIRVQTLGEDHPDTAQVLYNLARVYFELGQYSESEQLNIRALEIRKRTLPPDHLDIALSFNNLAFLYYLWGVKHEQTEQFFQLALPIFQQAVGLEHPRTAHCLSNLALFYADSSRYEEAEQLLLTVLDIRQRLLGSRHLDTARSLQNLAWLYIEQRKQERYEEAMCLLEESLAIRREVVGAEHTQTANSLHHMAMLQEVQGRYSEAEDLYQSVLHIRRKMLGVDNPKVMKTEECYAALLKKMGQEEKAAQLERHIHAVRDKSS